MLDRKTWRSMIRTAVQRNGACQNHATVRALAEIHGVINHRAHYRALFDRAAENGEVALNRVGMDCDCTHYNRVSIIDVPVSIIAWLKSEYEHERWLDGNENTYIFRPSSHPGGPSYSSRDLALEAFEDGHPHVVYA